MNRPTGLVLFSLFALALFFSGCTQPCASILQYCPDGSIQKVGPNCEQLPCPALDPNVQGCSNDIFSCPDGTNVGRIPPGCMFAPCTPTTGPDLEYIFPKTIHAKDSFSIENSKVELVYLGRDCGLIETESETCQSAFQFLVINESSGERKLLEAPFAYSSNVEYGEIPFVLKRARVTLNEAREGVLEIIASCPQRPLACQNGATPDNSGEDCENYRPCPND